MNKKIKKQIKNIILATTLINALPPTSILHAMDTAAMAFEDERKYSEYEADGPAAVQNIQEPHFAAATQEVAVDLCTVPPFVVRCECNEPRTIAEEQAMAPRTAAAQRAKTITLQEMQTFLNNCSQATSYEEKAEIVKQMIETYGIHAIVSYNDHIELIKLMKPTMTDEQIESIKRLLSDTEEQMKNLILRFDLKPDLTCNNQRLFTHIASVFAIENDIELLNIFMKHNIDVNVSSDSASTLLSAAVMGNTTEAVHILIANNADVNKADITGTTPMLIATALNNTDCAYTLIAHNADVNAASLFGKTPLELATTHDNTQLTTTLILAGAECTSELLNAFVSDYKTLALMSLAAKNDLEEQNWLPVGFIELSALPIPESRQKQNISQLIAEYANPCAEYVNPYHKILDLFLNNDATLSHLVCEYANDDLLSHELDLHETITQIINESIPRVIKRRQNRNASFAKAMEPRAVLARAATIGVQAEVDLIARSEEEIKEVVTAQDAHADNAAAAVYFAAPHATQEK